MNLSEAPFSLTGAPSTKGAAEKAGFFPKTI
jgi:hypothetical protein